MSDVSFKDAEAFLADLGVERRPLVVELPDTEAADDGAGGAAPSSAGAAGLAEGVIGDLSVEVDAASTEHVVADGTAETGAEVGAGQVVTSPPPLDEAIATAVATIRRITGAAPASEGRVRRKLQQRDHPPAVVDAALERARRERLVDDDALAAALVAEWRAKGHAPRRLRDDLRKREFDDAIIERAVAVATDDEPLAAAFALAKDRAGKMRHVEAETAFRRIHAYLVRRGHGDAVARKAARDAVFDDRERERTAGH